MTEFTTWRSLVDGAEISAMPDSVVFLPEFDDTTGRASGSKRGCQIETDLEWPKFDGKISELTTGATKAEIIREDDGELMGEVDISDKTGGDIFQIDLDVNLVPDETYNFVLTNPDENWTAGVFSDVDYPYVSDDGNLSVVGSDSFGASDALQAIQSVGNLGFD